MRLAKRADWIGGHVSQYVWDFNSRGADRLSDTTLTGLQLGRRFAPNWSVQAWWERNNAGIGVRPSYGSEDEQFDAEAYLGLNLLFGLR
ncbi:MAG: hypothetical protein KAG82_09210 [Alcanivoracaceae bacterium]|jgi:hypothetical protein|nr:hypothetical protein [Alcanivoracaceae bacterium]